MKLADLLDDAAARIGTALGLDRRESRIEARALAAHAWQVDRAWLIAHDTDLLTDDMRAALDSLVSRRLQGTPIAYLVGSREFYGRAFRVSPAVLIPRPDTELLTELALQRIPSDRPMEVLELGTGSGCIAITLALERPLARVTAVDRSAAALKIAQHNAATLHARVKLLRSDWFGALAGRRFGLIVSNPPYVAAADPHLTGDLRFEPLSALVGGDDGLDDLRHLAHDAPAHLKPGGVLLLEHGYDQADAMQALLRAQGFGQVRSWTDLAGIRRVSGGTLSE